MTGVSSCAVAAVGTCASTRPTPIHGGGLSTPSGLTDRILPARVYTVLKVSASSPELRGLPPAAGGPLGSRSARKQTSNRAVILASLHWLSAGIRYPPFGEPAQGCRDGRAALRPDHARARLGCSRSEMPKLIILPERRSRTRAPAPPCLPGPATPLRQAGPTGLRDLLASLESSSCVAVSSGCCALASLLSTISDHAVSLRTAASRAQRASAERRSADMPRAG